MVTKLKKISRSMFLKGIAFISILVCVFIFIVSIYNTLDVVYFESLFQSDMLKSEEFNYVYGGIIYNLRDALKHINNTKYDRYMSYFEKNKGIYYYVSDGTDIIQNTGTEKLYFEQFRSYIYVDYKNFYIKPDNPILKSYINGNVGDQLFEYDTKSDYKIYIGLSDEFLNPLMRQWNKDRYILINTCIITGIALLVSLIAFIYLLSVAGRKGSDDTLHLNFFDKLYTDINLVTVFTIVGLGIVVFYEWFYYGNSYYVQKFFTSGFAAAFVGISLIFILSLAKHIKNKSLIKHSLIYTVLHKIYNFFSVIFSSGPLMIKVIFWLMIFTLACIFGTLAFPMIIPVFIAGIYFVCQGVTKFKIVKYGVKSIKEGDVEHKILVSGTGEFAKLANDINSVAEGFDKAVKNELKSQRMKSELISNVSHDIKTPLTSIINYVDLLKKEGMDSENAPKYLDILEQKSQRLKVLTEDLFEAAKASSGDMPVELEKVDIFSLIQQGLAELEDRIQKSGLHFKINVPEEKIYVLADGKLLWRVVENLLSNVFKYALKSSRVYIDIIESDNDNKVFLTIKNISSYELNINVNELMERFKRADESRSSEGSGLGLAIAKDLMEMQKGSLNLEIDGDLFKATVIISKFM